MLLTELCDLHAKTKGRIMTLLRYAHFFLCAAIFACVAYCSQTRFVVSLHNSHRKHTQVNAFGIPHGVEYVFVDGILLEKTLYDCGDRIHSTTYRPDGTVASIIREDDDYWTITETYREDGSLEKIYR